MLTKEYRIPLPLTVEEYQIAQLYMIAKKSREESRGAGSGVEILVNEPYTEGPGGSGQYTKKIYHVGNHLPGWLKNLIKSALYVEEEAWNAYPYTKTRYTCPFVEKFSLEIETYYFPDEGHRENVFELTGSDFRNRVVDFMDIVQDQLPSNDYVPEEDPKLYVSQKTGRGPLSDNWIEDYWKEIQGKKMPYNGKAIMCAYKLCKVEFRYWGMQTKLEKFIHDVALRKTMLRAHIQAWVWQDEWVDLTMEDIRNIERETQELLKRKMGAPAVADCEDEEDEEEEETPSTMKKSTSDISKHLVVSSLGSIEKPDSEPLPEPVLEKRGSYSSADTRPTDAGDSQQKWMESIGRDSESESDDEFFDCLGSIAEDSTSLAKWSSLDLLAEEDPDPTAGPSVVKNEDSIFSHQFQRVVSERTKNSNRGRPLTYVGRASLDADASSCPGSPTLAVSGTAGSSPHHPTCSTSVLILIFHAGSSLDANIDLTAKKSDVTTFRGSFECVMRQHYPSMVGHVAIKLVSCPSICCEVLGVLSSLNPYSFDVSPSCTDAPHITHDSIPIGAIPLLATSTPEYKETIGKVVSAANQVFHDFIKSEEGRGFSGQICIVGDSIGSILAYDALCRYGQGHSRHDSENSVLEDGHIEEQDGKKSEDDSNATPNRLLTAPVPRRRSSSTSDHSQTRMDFDVSEFFIFGSPLPLVLAYRKLTSTEDKNAPVPRPSVQQVYNLFHPTDPSAARLEPLLSARFSMLPPINIPRYQKYPLGNGQPYHLLETIQTNTQLFSDNLTTPQSSHLRRMSEASIQSSVSGLIDSLPLQTINTLTQKWWGSKRLDYALYCPDGLTKFPTNALPHLFHASYWESCDVIAFILRQLGRFEYVHTLGQDEKELVAFSPNQPREKWIKKRTSVKVKNVAPNHRANDVIVRDGAPQILVGRFMYGPLDVITLAGERIDIHVMKDAPAGEWTLLSTEVSDKTGRVSYTIPESNALGYGLYPIKMVVRGDHTSADFYLAVVPPHTECVVFSIDGSFTASMSVSGRDPKVRAGAVDVVRHWQELGYHIIYITGRPDMQKQKVVSWLSQHNFPHGLVSFADGLSTDPLGFKTMYLKNLIQDHQVIVHCAYGSSKDITVYSSLGLQPNQIYIVGKVGKKQQNAAVALVDGYAAHLAQLVAPGGSRPAQGNARMVIPRGFFGLPGHNVSLRRRRNPAKRTKSFPVMGKSGGNSSKSPSGRCTSGSSAKCDKL